MADDDYPDDLEPYFANHPDSPSYSEDDRYNDWGWIRDGPGLENRQLIWERKQPAPPVQQDGNSCSPDDHVDDVTNKDLPPAPNTNTQLLPNSNQARLRPDRIAGYMRHLRRRHTANLNEWRRGGVDEQALPLPTPSFHSPIQPSTSTSSYQEDSSSSHDQMDDVKSIEFPFAPPTAMDPQVLNDPDQPINATHGLSIPEQIAAMNTTFQRRADIGDERRRVVDGQPLLPPPPSMPPSVATPSSPGSLPPSGPWGGLHLQLENFPQTIQSSANGNGVPVEMSGALPSVSNSSSPDSESPNGVQDNWSSETYQRAASFVPRMTEKVLQLLDVQPDDKILDIGCGDGVLTRKIAEQLKDGTGIIWGIDSSPAMIETARHHVSDGPVSHHRHGYSVIDATKLFEYLQCTDLTALNRHELGIVDSLQPVEERYTKIFSNAALHWILRNSTTRENVFMAIFSLLAPGGHLVFEMGGHGNVSELHTALLSATAHRVGIDAARAADPWFFADEAWIRDMLVKTGFLNLDLETEYRPTRATARGENGGGGIEGWVRLMGQTFLEVVREEEREDVVKEVCDVLKTVCTTERAEEWIGYVRLRVKAMKPSATMGEGVRDEEGQEFE